MSFLIENESISLICLKFCVSLYRIDYELHTFISSVIGIHLGKPILNQPPMLDRNKTLESQKQEIIDMAEERFGKDYFDRLDRDSAVFLSDDSDSLPKYTLTTNSQGAFYAGQE